MNQGPVFVLQQNVRREHGRKVQLENCEAAKVVADLIRTCLGPKAMLKMLLDPMGGIVLTNDGHAILREADVTHPAAKSMIELSRTQDEEVGDGTTSVIVLAGEFLSVAQPFLEQNIYPTQLIRTYFKALEDALQVLNDISFEMKEDKAMLQVVKNAIGTKFLSRWSDLMAGIALKAVQTVIVHTGNQKEVDFKRYVRVEKIPGGEIEESQVLNGVMLNKDITHPKMRRKIKNPRIILFDGALEYKKGESQTNVVISKENQYNRILQIEEEAIKKMCDDIIKFKPDIVITEKGLSDLAQHYLVQANITALRRVRKTDNHRIARAVGATIVNRPEELREEDVGTGCGEFYIEKIGDEYYSFLVECKNPKACTLLLRGASKDILNEMERNLQDAMNVARNVLLEPKLCPGGGATEMAIAAELNELANKREGIERQVYEAIATAFEVIPRTLIQNCGQDVIRTITKLRAKHAEGKKNSAFGINGETGKIENMKDYGVWEPMLVKSQTFKTAIEAACLLLRVDHIVSGLSKKKDQGGGGMVQQQDQFE